jgi:hypothetical protein
MCLNRLLKSHGTMWDYQLVIIIMFSTKPWSLLMVHKTDNKYSQPLGFRT